MVIEAPYNSIKTVNYLNWGTKYSLSFFSVNLFPHRLDFRSGVTDTSHRGISGDLGKERQGKKGKWRRKEWKSKKGRWKIENGRRESYKIKKGKMTLPSPEKHSSYALDFSERIQGWINVCVFVSFQICSNRLWMYSWNKTWYNNAPLSSWMPWRITAQQKDTCRHACWRWTWCLLLKWPMLSLAIRCLPIMTVLTSPACAKRLVFSRGWVN